MDNIEYDDSQKVINSLTAERTAVVKGVAGSGKSCILLYKAKQVSTYSNDYAIIVYTNTLKQFFIHELDEIDPSGKHVYSFHEWCKTKPKYKYLFIDECQDFSAEEIDDFKSHGTYCWFFGDSEQSIMEYRFKGEAKPQPVEKTASQLGTTPKDLCLNHRLTIENAKIGEHIKPQTHLSFACIKHGSKPMLIQSENQLDTIIDLIQINQLSNVGILVYYNDSVGILKDYFLKKGIPVEYKIHDNMQMDFKSTNPKIISWHCAKGLQLDDVFIPACGCSEHAQYQKSAHPIDPIVADEKKSALYVAATRPISNLYLLYTSNLTSNLPPASSEIYWSDKKEADSDVYPTF